MKNVVSIVTAVPDKLENIADILSGLHFTFCALSSAKYFDADIKDMFFLFQHITAQASEQLNEIASDMLKQVKENV